MEEQIIFEKFHWKMNLIVWLYNSCKEYLWDKTPHSNIFSFSEPVNPQVPQKKNLHDLLLGKSF